MEEEDRKTKLQAGKDALLAFQKKKKQKKKRTKEENVLADESNTLHMNTLSSHDSFLQDTLCDDTDHPPPNNVVTMETDNHAYNHIGPNNVVADDAHFHNDISHAHSSSTRDGIHVVELNQLVTRLRDENHLLTLELASSRQDYEGALMTGTHYRTELGTMQMKILSSEEVLVAKQQELDECQSSFDAKMNKIVQEREQLHVREIAQEREKHLQHITRLTEELQQATPTSIDGDELEAQRIKQLKTTLEEMYEKEKETLLVSAQREKDLLKENYEKERERIEGGHQETIKQIRQDLETKANEQIRQFHSQYVTAHTSLVNEKQSVERELSEVQKQYRYMQNQMAGLEREKDEVSERFGNLEEVYTHQLKAVENNSLDVDNRLQNWREKASGLETRLQQTTVDHSQMLLAKDDSLRQLQISYEQESIHHEEAVKSLENKQEEIEVALEESQLLLEKQVREKEEALKQLEVLTQRHDQQLEELQERHTNELSQMEAEKSNQVSLLEVSISESTTSQASLEFAERHMKELQQQLNAYRNQETSHKTALDTLEQDHTHKIEMMSQQYKQELSHLVETHTLESNDNQSKITSLTSVADQLRVERDDLKGTLSDVQEQRVEQETEHQRNLADVKVSHSQEVKEIKTNLGTLYHKQLEQERESILSAKGRELETVKETNRIELQNLKDSLSSTGEQALASSKIQLIELGHKLREYETESKETRHFQEQAHKHETELKTCRVTLSLLESELNTVQRTNLQEIESITTVANSLKIQVEELTRERDTIEKTFETTLQEKEDEIVTNISHCQALQLRVTELTRELEEERNVHVHVTNESLKLSTVHTQLTQAKERCASLKKEWSEQETSLQVKLQEQQKVLNARQKEWELQSHQYIQKINSLQQKLDDESSRLASNELKLVEETQKLTTATQHWEHSLGTATGRVQELALTKSSLEQQLMEALDQVKDLQQQMCSLQKQLSSEDQQQVIVDLREKLEVREQAAMEIQKEFEQKLNEAETKQLSLQKKMLSMQRVEGRLGSLVNERGGLEKSLARSRQSLIEKLREKEVIEKDLTYHRTHLERRLMEKQRLEELLYEKNRYEKELYQQKQLLTCDLDNIEKKLQSKDNHFNSDHSDMSTENKVENDFESTQID